MVVQAAAAASSSGASPPAPACTSRWCTGHGPPLKRQRSCRNHVATRSGGRPVARASTSSSAGVGLGLLQCRANHALSSSTAVCDILRSSVNSRGMACAGGNRSEPRWSRRHGVCVCVCGLEGEGDCHRRRNHPQRSSAKGIGDTTQRALLKYASGGCPLPPTGTGMPSAGKK